MKYWGLFLSFFSLLFAVMTLVFGSRFLEAQAAFVSQPLLFVAPQGQCNGAAPCFASIQAAVDAAHPGDEIRIAKGVYSDVHTRQGSSQIVYISSTVSLAGGFSISDWNQPDPQQNPTILAAQGQGRGIYLVAADDVSIDSLVLTGGDAAASSGEIVNSTHEGGGLFAVNSSLALSNNHIISNSAGTGGGFFTRDSHLTLTANHIASNWAIISGAGFSLEAGEAWIEQNTIQENSGGGIALSLNTSTLKDNTIISNTNASGISILKGDAWLEDNLISQNQAEAGAGLLLSESDAVLINNHITYNSATAFGAGMLVLGGTTSLRGNTVAHNSNPEVGGGIYVEFGELSMLQNSISHNSSQDFAGGLGIVGGTISLVDNQFVGNSSEMGGGIRIAQVDGILRNNYIAENNAEIGGGVHLSQSDPLLMNNVFRYNTAAFAGAGIAIQGSAPRLQHSTFIGAPGISGNAVSLQSDGLTYSAVSLTNTIMVSFTLGISVPAGQSADIEGVLWFGNTVNIGGSGDIKVEHEVTGPPAFASDGFHLQAGSAAIEEGTNCKLGYDIDYEPRPKTECDLGADEFWLDDEIQRMYLPILWR